MLSSGKMVVFPLVISWPWHYTRWQRNGTWEAATLEVKVREVGERLPI